MSLSLATCLLAEDAEHRGQNHDDQKITVQVVAGLEQDPDRGDAGDQDVEEDQVPPALDTDVHRQDIAQCDTRDEQHQGDDRVLRGAQVRQFLEQQSKEDCRGDEEHRGGRHLPVGMVDCGGETSRSAEALGADVGECRDDKDGKEVAEQQEKPLAGLADVFLDNEANRFALVVHRSVHCAIVLDGSNENAANQTP